MSPQFHVVYDDDFTTVPHWAQLVSQSAESTISDNNSTTWEFLGPSSHQSAEEDFTTRKDAAAEIRGSASRATIIEQDAAADTRGSASRANTNANDIFEYGAFLLNHFRSLLLNT